VDAVDVDVVPVGEVVAVDEDAGPDLVAGV